ncbi:MAG: hypothetical protein HXX18_06475 [Bacteroidetes bacterium]|nr:hypothetical protein [Bacteroidota bacterium]
MHKFKVSLVVLLFLLLLLSTEAICQSPTNLDKAVLYRKEKAFFFVLHNEGWGIGYRKGNHLAFNKTRFWEGELVGMSHPKETKTENPYFSDSHGFVYGQLNSLYILRGGLGYKRMLNDKPYWGGVQLSYVYFGGASLGLARPKSLYIINIDKTNPNGYYLSLERYDPNKHFLDNIYGGGPLLKGFESLKPYPGIYAKFGFNFEFGEYDEKIRAIEVGGIIDYYFAKIPMMAFNDYPNYFLTIYISVHFGKRYNLY